MTGPVLHIDIECYNDVDITKTGLARYAEDPSAELLCAAYFFDNGPLYLWVPVEAFEFPDAARPTKPCILELQSQTPQRIVDHTISGGEVRAFNAAYERYNLNRVVGAKVGFPHIDIKQTVCVQAKAAVNGLPRDLEGAAVAAGTHRKDENGRNNMLQLARPRRGKVKRYTLDNAPDKFRVLFDYCIDDVLAECALDKFLPDLTPLEQSIYCLDQKINDVGVNSDRKACADFRHVIDMYRFELAKEFVALTGLNPTQGKKIAEWIKANGYPQLENMQAATIKTILEDQFEAPQLVQRVLRIYSVYGSKAVSKFYSMPDMVCSDGRLRHMFVYYGAGPGRWSSRGVQLQNMMRPVIDDVDLAIEMFEARSLESIKTLWGPEHNPMKVAGSCVRGMLVPSEGRKILAVDFAGIESRITAWIHDEEWKLDVFRAYDAGTGPDSYKRAVAKLLRMPVEEVTKRLRQAIGKVTELAFGYEGGVAALVKMAAQNNVDLEEIAELAYPSIPQDVLERAEYSWGRAEERGMTLDLDRYLYVALDALKLMWRAEHPRVSKGWGQLKTLAADAVENPGTAFALPNKKIMFKVEDHWLRMRLPSGRKLSYYKPLCTGTRDQRYDGRVVSYMGIDTETRQWHRVNAYGGRWMQNIGEGVARDLLTPAMLTLDAEGYDLVGSVHDEAIADVTDAKTLARAFEIMCVKHNWAHGLPVAVDGFVKPRYEK